ncbi:hypothetical protein C8Q74DRAFT_1272734 [Fomes fomentarius]|nr:hypothetical protein C8Q74DRAFT_1272734 [Fomes fomentarius]
MHRALLVFDILGYIFQFSAIQALWSDIPDLTPLVRCFHHDARVAKGNSVVSKHNFGSVISLSQPPVSSGQTLLRPLTPED